MNISQMETFVWIATLKNFNAVAHRLNVTQPGISARIAGLENELGTKLLIRHNKRVALTSHGRRFLRYAQDVLRLTDDLRAEREVVDKPVPMLRLGIVGTLAFGFLPGFLNQMAEKFPYAEIDIIVDSAVNIQKHLSNREIDAAFINGMIYETDIRAFHLGEIELKWIASPKLVKSKKKYTVSDVIKNRIISFEEGTHVNLELRRLLKTYDTRPPCMIGCSSVGILIELVNEGYGIGTLPELTVRRQLESGEIVVVNAPLRLPTFDVFVCYAMDSPSKNGISMAEMARSFAASILDA